MGEGNPAFVESLVVAARRRLSEQVLAQGEKLDMLGQGLEELRARQKELEAAFESELEAVATAASAAVAGNSSFEKLLGSVRNIITATLPEQVFEVLSEEGAQMGVRAAVFDVRGKAAWGASMGGLGRELTAKALRTLVVPLSQDNPFRQAPPHQIRTLIWQYWFTSMAEKRQTGMWWRRQLLGRYAPTLEKTPDGEVKVLELPDANPSE